MIAFKKTAIYHLLIFSTALLGLVRIAPAKTAATAAGHRAMPGVIALGIKNTLPAAATLSRTGISTLDPALQALQIHTLVRIAPVSPASMQKTGGETRIDNLYYAYFSGTRPPEEVARELARNPAVEFAEAKYYYTLTAVPNDPLLNKQYYINKIKLPQAWDISKGEQGSVVIAIIDGGTDITHPDLVANLWTNPGEIAGNGIDDDANGYVDDLHGWNFSNNSPNPASIFAGTTYSDHGTHTAGLACATANNSLGIAGTSWNARLMAINAGSKTSDSSIDPLSIDKAISYAVANGADILSCSFSGAYSELTRRLIQNATEHGAAVVAAAGNGATLADDVYPASFPYVLAVAATDSGDTKPYFSNYGYTVDVAAPGVNIWSTVAGGYKGDWSGTSMATPITAGVVALVMTRHPEWSGLQAAEQVRVTADNIDTRNPDYMGKLGHGRINAWRALTESSPALDLVEAAFIDEDADNLIKPGETVQISVTLINRLAATGAISLQLQQNSPYAAMSRSTAATAALATGQSIKLENAFEFKVSGSAPSGHPILFTLTMIAGDYRETAHFTLTVLPSFANIGINNIASTVTNIGRIGFVNPGADDQGLGFQYKANPSLLFEGAIIAGTGPSKIVNAARSLLALDGTQANDADFIVAEGGDVHLYSPGALGDQESHALFSDAAAAAPLNIRITQETFAWSQLARADMIFFRYTVQNLNALALENFHFGLFFDWDMDAGSYATNIAAYDPERRMGYAYDAGNGPDTYVGSSLLTPGEISYRAIVNDPADPLNPTWGLHDGFTDAEKWEAISGGLAQTRVGPADISNVIATGPFSIAPYGSITVDFVLLAADNLEHLQAGADSARALWLALFPTFVQPQPEQPKPTQFALQANYPNPFNAGTKIEYSLPSATNVRLELFDLAGRMIRTLVSEWQPAGSRQIRWDGRNQQGEPAASGAYFYRLKTDDREITRKLLLIR